jgi:endonuclease/exonuclease/phosphatase family metal-dependent hydrolase
MDILTLPSSGGEDSLAVGHFHARACRKFYLNRIESDFNKGTGGVDRRYRPERVIEAIAHSEPDIVFLQEVDDGVPRSRNHKQVNLIGDTLDFPHRAYQRNVALSKEHYGNAILSHFPSCVLRQEL